jgi:hypothetical protein
MENAIYTHCKNLTHALCSGAAELAAKCIEGLKECLVECITNNLNVHFIQILFTDAVNKKWSCK